MQANETDSYEPWADEFRSAYDRAESAMFVLHNNIGDIYPKDGQYISCRRYLERMLEHTNYVVINYDVSRGMRFLNDADAQAFVKLANKGRDPDDRLIRSIYDFPKDSLRALAFIEAFIVGLESKERPVAVILDYADHLAPNGHPQSMPEVDRVNGVTLQRFAQLFYERLQAADARDAVCFLLTPNLHGLHPDLVRSEYVTAIDVPRPDAEQRRRFISWQQAKFVVEQRPTLELDLTPEQLVEATAGLTLTGIRHLFLKSLQSEERRLSRAFVVQKKRQLLERDSRGMLSVIDSKHGLDAVGGHDKIKTFLRQTADDLRAGRTDVPVGIVCPGPNGVGKTFIAKAFARDAGVNAVVLQNFRGMYVGQTEGNLDIIFNILKAMTPNIVVIDEADKMLGNERESEGNKVDDRVFGAFTAFMGDPEYRGRIFWLLLTARPFNLAPDTGRPGRVEEHVPILAPETYADKLAVLQAVLKLRKMTLESESGGDPTQGEYEALFGDLGFVTPAALELIANRARRARRQLDASKESTDSPVVSVPMALFREEARSFVPEGSQAKLQLQTVEAVLYTNHLSYLPEPWRTRLKDDPEGLMREREDLRRRVGYS